MKIIQDTREKPEYAYNFSFFNHEVERRKLDTGDYSIAGFEDKICVERKRNTGEISMNLGSKWRQFSAEIDRMLLMPYKIILCEFSQDDLDIFPKNSGIPYKRWKYLRMSGAFIKKRLFTLSETHNIPIIFSPSKEEAETIAEKFLRESYEKLTNH